MEMCLGILYTIYIFIFFYCLCYEQFIREPEASMGDADLMADPWAILYSYDGYTSKWKVAIVYRG